MKAMHTLKRMMMAVGFLCVIGGAVGCGNDLYAPCQLDENSQDPFIRACAQGGNTSCAVENYIQCDTRVCARYEGSEPYCTAACQDDADCVNGQCRELVLQSGRKFCVQIQ